MNACEKVRVDLDTCSFKIFHFNINMMMMMMMIMMMMIYFLKALHQFALNSLQYSKYKIHS